MAKYKISESAIGILWEGLKLYCSYFPKYSFYMLFPVLGQVFGLIWIFSMTYVFTNNAEYLMTEIPAMNNFPMFLGSLFLIILPGLILWIKAFWDYLVAYGALNSMTEAAMGTGKIYDFPAYNAVVTEKIFTYLSLWFLFSIFVLVSSIPIVWIAGLIFFVYYVLIFQVFTFEDNVSAIGCFKRSRMLIKGNFAKTLAMMLVLFAITFCFLELGISVIFDAIKLTPILLSLFEGFAATIPLDGINSYLALAHASQITPLDISNMLVQEVILFIVAGFTLPLRSIVWTLWYKHLSDRDGVPEVVKKGTRKKLDPEILRRAKKKD